MTTSTSSATWLTSNSTARWCRASRRPRCRPAGKRPKTSFAALRGQPRQPFRYRDKGMLATIGRGAAVAKIGPIKASGFFAWLLWLFVHIFFLIGFRNRLIVMIHWAWSYVTFDRGARLDHRAAQGAAAGI